MKKLFLVILAFIFVLSGYSQIDSSLFIFNELRVNSWVKVHNTPAYKIDGYNYKIFNGDTLTRISKGPLKAEEAEIYPNGSSMSTPLQAAFDYISVKWVSFGSDSSRVYIFNTSVNGHGKTVEFKNGNTLNGTGTIDSIIVVASDHDRIFGPGLTITNLRGSNGYISPQWFGAIGDGVTDDTSPLQKALSQPNIMVKALVGSTYYVTDSLTLYWSSTIKMPAGSLISTNLSSGKHGIMIGSYDASNQSLMKDKEYSIRIKNLPQSNWTDTNNIGVKVVNLVYSKVSHVSSSRFTIGMKTIGYNAGLAYVDYNLGLFDKNMVDVWIATLNPSSLAWNNQNNYYGGGFAVGSENAGMQSWGVWIGNGSYSVTNNNFYGTSIEKRSNSVPFLIISGSRNKLWDFRSENNSDTTVRILRNGTSNTNNNIYAARDGGTGFLVDSSYSAYNFYTSAERIAYEKANYSTVAELNNIAEHCIYLPDSSVNIRYPGLFQTRSGGGDYAVNTLSGVRLVGDYVQILSTDNYGISTDYIDVSDMKQLVIKQLIDTSGGAVGANVMVSLYDKNGKILGDTAVIQTGYTMTYTSTYGYGFFTTNAAGNDVRITLPTIAKKIIVKFNRPNSGSTKLKGYKIIGYKTGLTAIYNTANNPQPFNLSPSVPTLGSFMKGKIIYNSSPSEASARGWICTSSGTFDPGSTLAGVTGSISNGSNRLILNSGSGLKVQKGQWLNLNSVPSQIIGIATDTVYINRVLTGSTITGGAIAFSVPVFITLSGAVSQDSVAVYNGKPSADTLAFMRGDSLVIKSLEIDASIKDISADSVIKILILTAAYSPSRGNPVNVSSSSVAGFSYTKTGNRIHVSGTLRLTPTASSITTSVELSLYGSPTLTGPDYLIGSGVIVGSNNNVIIEGNGLNNAATVTFTSISTSEHVIKVWFDYPL